MRGAAGGESAASSSAHTEREEVNALYETPIATLAPCVARARHHGPELPFLRDSKSQAG